MILFKKFRSVTGRSKVILEWDISIPTIALPGVQQTVHEVCEFLFENLQLLIFDVRVDMDND